MTGSPDREAFELFDAVVDLEPEARRARLDERCAGAPGLRALVERMLAEDAGAGGGLELDAGAGVDLIAAALHGGREEPMPERVGRYRLVRPLGRGGMGVVYEGEQDVPRRRVALKLMRDGLASDEARRRFRREAQLLGQLQHRGIAHVYEAGVAPVNGVDCPFIAMELVDGPPLDRHAEQHELGTRARMELLARVCDAVGHAHQKGILHRDLKPQNVLVVGEGSSVTAASDSRVAPIALGQPKVLDFGVARLLERDASEPGDTLLTGAGSLVGTLAYMSPEQVEGRAEAIDTRADIWSLGVILYQLVTGALPFDVTGLTVVEAANRIATAEPRRPRVPDASVRADLATIVGRALEKDPARRYGSAGELADDLRRCLRDEPILARRPTLAYQFRKFARRNRALVVGACATTLALVGGLVAVSILLARVSAERDETTLAQQRQERIAGFQSDVLASLDLQGMGATIRARLDEEVGAQLDAMDPTAALTPLDVRRLLDGVNATNLARASLETQLIDRAAARVEDEYGDDPLVAATLHYTVARMYQSFWSFDKQLEQDRRALMLRRANLGEDDPATIESYISASRAAEWAMQPELALEWALAAVAGTERTFGPDHPRSLRARLQLAGQLVSRDPRQSEEILLELIERARAHGQEMQEILDDARAILAGAYGSTGRFEQAIEIYESLAAEPGAPPGLKANLAGSYMLAGRLDDAVAMRREDLEDMRLQFGEQDERTIMARHNLAPALLALERRSEAEVQLAAAYAGSLVGLAPSRDHRMSVAASWATVLLADGRLDECERVLNEAIASRRRATPYPDGWAANLLELRAHCRRALGRDLEADEDERESVVARTAPPRPPAAEEGSGG